MDEKTDYDSWDMKISEWRGYTLKALEDMNKELSGMNTELKEIKSQLIGIKIKVAAIGGTSGIIASVIMYLLTKV